MSSPRKPGRTTGFSKSVISLARHLQRMAPALRATVEAARRAVKAAAPEAIEVAYQTKPPRSKSAWWKIARYLVGDAEVVGIAAVSTRATLYLYRGGELDDGSTPLEGGGSAMRSIRLNMPSDASKPEVKRMLRRAFRLASEAHRKGRTAKKPDPAIDEYLEGVSPKSRALLQTLRKTIHSIVPEVEECISYRMPAFRYQGRIIAGFQATSTGCSYYPFSGTTLATLTHDIDGYSQTKSALHFGSDDPLPASLVRKLLNARIAESRARRTR